MLLSILLQSFLLSSPSPSEELVVFLSEQDGNKEIYSMRLDGSEKRRLTDDPGADTSPYWSPDGKRVFFFSDRSGESRRFSMLPDGSDVRVEKEAPGSVSPDGRWTVHQRRHKDGRQYLVARGAEGEERVVFDRADTPLTSACGWSPAGDAFLLLAGRGYGSLKIHLWDPELESLTLLTSQGGTHNGADWSPDGEWILFNSNRGDGSMRVYVMRPDGTEPQRVLDQRASHASWTRDGRVILDTEFKDPDGWEVAICAPDGSGLERLTRSGGNGGWPSVRR